MPRKQFRAFLTKVVSPAINLHFARDLAGRITATGSGPGANPLTESYGYDWLSHLTSVNNAAGITMESYTHDDVGNRLSKTGNGLATGNYAYGYAPNTNWLKATGNAARSVDANGNTTASSVGDETFGFGYNGRNRLTVVQRNGSTVGTYTYNALGQRVGKVATFPASITSSYLYDENSQLLGEYGDTMRDYLWLDGIPVAVSDTKLRGGLSLSFQTTTSYVHADGLNTPRAITDASGKVQWQWSYTGNPFGEQLPTSSTGFVYNLRYAGQYYDAESRLMDNIHRTYEPATGRYLQSDPIGLAGGWSTYAYVGGNSLNAADPLGLWVYTGNPTQCALFSGGLRMARDAATSPDLDAAQQATLAGAVNAYGREGDSSVRIVFNQENNFTGAVTGLRKNGVRFTSIV